MTPAPNACPPRTSAHFVWSMGLTQHAHGVMRRHHAELAAKHPSVGAHRNLVAHAAEEDAGDGGWDNHYRNFQIMQDRHGPWLDQGLSALLA